MLRSSKGWLGISGFSSGYHFQQHSIPSSVDEIAGFATFSPDLFDKAVPRAEIVRSYGFLRLVN
jgi:hypothetical protein